MHFAKSQYISCLKIDVYALGDAATHCGKVNKEKNTYKGHTTPISSQLPT